jgi:hypothetical protein
VNPDAAAALLQIEERGLALLQLCNENEDIAKAISNIQSGFEPRDVAKLYGLEWTEPEPEEPEGPDTARINVWTCKTARCRQKERVSTATVQPQCPSCSQPMDFLMAVEYEEDISHMRRTFVPEPRIKDPLERTDRWRDSAPASSLGDD